MKLAIEKWLDTQNFDKESIELYREGIICYKAGAYRAGFLFSYLGTQSVLRDRVLKGDRPDTVKEHFWDDIVRKLRDDDKWETAIWDAQISRKHGSVFGLEDGHLRIQLEYWKGIRNDCAHAKDNEIIAAHVESYWAFLRSNLPKLVVSGGKDSIINRINKYFDPKYTPDDADPTPIIRDIAFGVKSDDLVDVFVTLDKETKKHVAYIFGFYEDSKPALFWKGIIEQDNSVSTECIRFLKNQANKSLYHVFDAYPNIVSYLSDDHEFVRNFWYEKIEEVWKPFQILASLLESDCVPPEQTEEAIISVIRNSKNTNIDKLTYQRLDKFGFSPIFKKEVFLDQYNLLRDFEWANSKKTLIKSFLENYGIDEDIVISVSSAFSSPAHPFELRHTLFKLFSLNNTLRSRMEKIAEEKSIVLPDILGFKQRI